MLGFKKIAETEGWDIETVWNRYKDSDFNYEFTGSFDIKGDKNAIFVFSWDYARLNSALTIDGVDGNRYGKMVAYGGVSRGGIAFFYIPVDATVEISTATAALQNIYKMKCDFKIVHGYSEYSLSPREALYFQFTPPKNYNYAIMSIVGSQACHLRFRDINDNQIEGVWNNGYLWSSSGICKLTPEIVKYDFMNESSSSSGTFQLNLLAVVK